ncbi:hypothetical protein FQN57_004075 [Myotisia sp. PD_48]|nr:hypothetical protein FQN57_004075 [Myotisia sp. PD_48]
MDSVSPPPQHPQRPAVPLADIYFPASQSQSISNLLSDLRRSALSIPNRLGSIYSDSKYVQRISDEVGFPLVANERCGSWYIPSHRKLGGAYFKSTDGHTALPDALSKTVPIWAAVINRTLFPELPKFHKVQFLPNFLISSEESQIEIKIDSFVLAFKDLNLNLEDLRKILGKPIELTWAVQDYYDPEYNREHPETHVMVLCCASKRVYGAEISENGYIQGAGDDSEAWSHGLTAPVFWQYKDILMDASEADLPDLITELIQNEKSAPAVDKGCLIKPTRNVYVGKESGIIDVLSSFDLVINCYGKPDPSDKPKILNLGCSNGKAGSRQLRKALEKVRSFLSAYFSDDPLRSVVIMCDDGKDISIGTTLMILCLFYNDKGVYDASQKDQLINKQYIRRRLAWILSSKHDANPSRSTLQSVNAFLMDPPIG